MLSGKQVNYINGECCAATSILCRQVNNSGAGQYTGNASLLYRFPEKYI